jgi:transcriptional regulator with XRE-family HTH domain
MSQKVIEVLLANLNGLTKAQGLNQPALAKRAGVNGKTVNNLFKSMERGMSPTLDTLIAVAKALGVSVADLLAGAGPPISVPLEQPHLLARQLGRLTEDFLLSSADGRQDILRLAEKRASRRGGTE